ncbi:MAG: FAD-dependent oxidoreductase [Candidatus Bathyarchaeota archaeon]|nr:FAD-dependent oxidoreductase [Candidatus Bathyarchaeota archaeon]
MKFETFVKEIVPRVEGVASFRFPRPAELVFKAGQYMLVTLNGKEKELVHAFSISSSPTETGYIEFTKKFTDSEYSTILKNLKPQDKAHIDAPHGSFTFEGEHPKIALLTGGIGITPFRSICKYCTDKQVNSQITLFYGCRNPSEITFKDDLEQMQKQNKNLKLVFTVNEPDSNWQGPTGNINAELVKKQLPDYKDHIFYACGPPGMVKAMTNMIKELELPEKQLKLESFAGY